MNHALQQGQIAVLRKNFPAAIAHFSQALQISPKDAQAHACLGQALCWNHQRETGIEHLRQSGQILLKKAKKSRDINLILELIAQLHHWDD